MSLTVERQQTARFDLPDDIRRLKQRARAFIEREVWPVEEKVAQTERSIPRTCPP